MNKLGQLMSELNECYQLKTNYVEDYLSLGEEGRKNLCKVSRQNLLNHVNSENLLMGNLLKEQLLLQKGNEL